MKNELNIIRQFQGYKVIKVKRNYAGSFAVEYKGNLSRQFSSSTWNYYKNESNEDFRIFCKQLLNN